MNNLDLVQKDGVFYTDSRQVAAMIGKQHGHLVRDIEEYRQYMNGLENPKLDSQNFFIKSTYKVSSNNKTYPCYLITKKGCELIAHKLTGKRGVQFSATYITQFHEMENRLNGSLEAALLNGLEEIRQIKEQMLRGENLLSARKTQEMPKPDRNFWSIREYAELINAVLPQNIAGLGQRAARYSSEHGMMVYRKRTHGSVTKLYHLTVLKWLFDNMQGGARHD